MNLCRHCCRLHSHSGLLPRIPGPHRPASGVVKTYVAFPRTAHPSTGCIETENSTKYLKRIHTGLTLSRSHGTWKRKPRRSRIRTGAELLTITPGDLRQVTSCALAHASAPESHRPSDAAAKPVQFGCRPSPLASEVQPELKLRSPWPPLVCGSGPALHTLRLQQPRTRSVHSTAVQDPACDRQ